MLKKYALLSVFAFCFIVFASADETVGKIKREILIAPVVNLTENKEFTYLQGTIYNVLLINFKKQETLAVLNENPEVEKIIKESSGLEEYLEILRRSFPGGTAIVTEYYVAREKLHLVINVWDLDTLRVKKSFIETMPADLDMLQNLERMAAGTAAAVARDLPPTEREALFQKQVAASLRKRINDEEKMVEDVFSLQHEISAVPFTGIGLGRTVFSWSILGPFISPVINLEYTWYFASPYHLRCSLEYLGFDLMEANRARTEISFDALVGFHTVSLFSMSFDAGLAVIYDYNPASGALAYTLGIGTFAPPAERLSISLPVQLGLTVYISKNFFIAFRLKYHGLTWTFEPLPPEAYDVGSRQLKYNWGFSPWNLLCLSFLIRAGVRF